MDVEKVDSNIILREGTEPNENEDILFEILSIEDWVKIGSITSIVQWNDLVLK
jgi:hypothetical protein